LWVSLVSFARHNPLKGTATSNVKGKRIFRYRLSPESFVCTAPVSFLKYIHTRFTSLNNDVGHIIK